jgi:hypothetical protein
VAVMKSFKIVVCASVLGLAFATPAQATPVIFSDSFNSNPSDQLNGTPSGWTVADGIPAMAAILILMAQPGHLVRIQF